MMIKSEKMPDYNVTENMLCITIDIEWSPDELVESVVQTLNEHKVKATFFATHPITINGHEISLHPNYSTANKYRKTITKLHNLFPNSKGVRSHRLTTDEMLLPIYKELGLVYDSGYVMMNMKNIQPFYLEHDIVEMPIFYMDRLHFDEPRFYKKGFSINSMDLNSAGLKVFDFHPIHIFINTNKVDLYQKAKRYYHESKLLEQFKNKNKGIGTYFSDLLQYIVSTGTKTYTLLEIYNKYIQENKLND